MYFPVVNTALAKRAVPRGVGKYMKIRCSAGEGNRARHGVATEEEEKTGICVMRGAACFQDERNTGVYRKKEKAGEVNEITISSGVYRGKREEKSVRTRCSAMLLTMAEKLNAILGQHAENYVNGCPLP